MLQYTASVGLVRMCAWWYLHVPIHVGSVEPRKEPDVQLPSPALLFTNLVNLGESWPLQAIGFFWDVGRMGVDVICKLQNAIHIERLVITMYAHAGIY